MNFNQSEEIIKDTYQEVRELYAGNDVDYFVPANEHNEIDFFKKAQTRPITRVINSVYRLRQATKDFIYYQENLKSTDYLGNRITHFRTIGKRLFPEFTTQYNESGEQAKYIDSSKTEYDIPFSEDFVKKEIEPFLGERPNFYVIQWDKKYGGFGLQELAEYNHDDLVRLGQYGTTNPTEIKQIEKKKRLA